MPSRTERNYKPRGEDERPLNRIERAINYTLFTGVIVLLVLWMIPQVEALVSGGVSSTVAVRAEPSNTFPSITLCSFEANVSLLYQSCADPAGKACFGAKRNDTGDYSCTTFNYDYTSPIVAEQSGLKGLLTIQFRTNRQLYPPDAALFGAQAVLHEPGTYPDVEGQAIFLSPGQATIITLRRTQTTHLPPPKGIGGTTVSWEASTSILAIDPAIPNADDAVLVGFMYRELAVLDIQEIELTTVTQFLGIFAGVIGVLLGLDVLNVSIVLVGIVFTRLRRKRAGKRGTGGGRGMRRLREEDAVDGAQNPETVALRPRDSHDSPARFSLGGPSGGRGTSGLGGPPTASAATATAGGDAAGAHGAGHRHPFIADGTSNKQQHQFHPGAAATAAAAAASSSSSSSASSSYLNQGMANPNGGGFGGGDGGGFGGESRQLPPIHRSGGSFVAQKRPEYDYGSYAQGNAQNAQWEQEPDLPGSARELGATRSGQF